jgi:hypothetical protein
MSFISSPNNFMGAFPILKSASLGSATPAYLSIYPQYMPGWSNNGDYVKLPYSVGDDIEYYNNAEALQWGVDKTAINAACNKWCGITFDGTDIYVVAANTATAPDTYYSAKINSAGTVTNIGNAQPSSDWGNTGMLDFVGSNGAGFLDLDASGNLRIGNANEYAILDKSTGAFNTQPTSFGSNCGYVTADGQYRLGYFNTNNILASLCRLYVQIPGTTRNAQLEIPLATGTPYQVTTETVRFVVWGDYVSQSYQRRCPAFWDRAAFDSWVEKVTKAGGYL